MIQITFPDGRVQAYENGTTALQIAQSISESLARNVLAAEVNQEVWDATRPISHDATLHLLTWEQLQGKSTLWHSAAHLMAEALEALYPGIQFWVGPPVEQGFYYDVDLNGHTLTPDNFAAIEAKMLDLARQNNPYQRIEKSKTEAVDYFTEKNDPYKLDLLQRLNDGEITFYKQGQFTDLCKGPHIPHTGFIKAVKLMNVAGAYWKGDENNKMLTRIYGIAFTKEKDLKAYLHMLEEAKKRDHRKLGKELELFTFSEKVGMGLPLWLPKGAMLRERLIQFMQRAQLKAGYVPVATPHIAHKDLYVCSGHYEKYGSDAFKPILTPHEGEAFYLKPMNCPHHCEIYNSEPRSYKDLPLRFAEFGTVYRYEQSGELHGLTRVRGFTQDDAHIFCQAEQVKEEFKIVIDLVLYVLKALEFKKFTAQISLRDPNNPEKYIGSEENWNRAESAIIEATQELGLETSIVYGEAAFYGPKLDFMVQDALGREWQLGTIQVDYNLPERFQLTYTGSDGQKHRPVMIHRAPFGSMERFVAVLLEHTGGNLPLWLVPDQVAILPISEKHLEYAQSVLNLFKKHDIRGLIDERSEKAGKKIRDAEMSKIPYMLVVGEKEAETQTVSVRKHGGSDLGSMSIEAFAEMIKEETTF